MPFDNITNKHFDSGDYPEALRRALAAVDLKSVRERQKRGEPDGRLIGVGLAVYCEQGAHGTSVYAGWGIPMVPGHEQATARMTPDGGLELSVGVHSHGQSMETTLAQVAHEILGVEIARIKVVHGDTEYTPYSTGTWGSRSAVMAGGAVATATREVARLAKAIGAHLLQTDAEIRRAARRRSPWAIRQRHAHGDRAHLVSAPAGPAGFGRSARPRGDDRLQAGPRLRAPSATPPMSRRSRSTLTPATSRFSTTSSSRTAASSSIRWWWTARSTAALAQGVGTALYEEMNFDSSGQPLASTFADYLLPGPTEVPAPRLIHMETLVALHGIRRERSRRGRRHRAAGGDRQRRQRRPAAARRRSPPFADDAAPRA